MTWPAETLREYEELWDRDGRPRWGEPWKSRRLPVFALHPVGDVPRGIFELMPVYDQHGRTEGVILVEVARG